MNDRRTDRDHCGSAFERTGSRVEGRTAARTVRYEHVPATGGSQEFPQVSDVDVMAWSGGLATKPAGSGVEGAGEPGPAVRAGVLVPTSSWSADGVLADLAVPVRTVPVTMLTGSLDETFRRDDDLRRVVVDHPEGPRLLERSWFERLMTGPLGYGRLLHARTCLGDLHQPETMIFDATVPVGQAAAAVIGRESAGARFDAVVVTDRDQERSPDSAGRVGVVPVAALFERLARHYAYQSLHDPLTGLPNRLGLMERLRHVARDGQRAALLYVDLDRFKDVNDLLGHAAGDQVLVQFAERLQSVCRAGDMIVRLGGDEFAILTDLALSPVQSTALAERVVLQASSPYAVAVSDSSGEMREELVSLGASVGVAHSDGSVATTHLTSLEVLLKQADLAMYRAKARGRGRVAHFDQDQVDDHSHDEQLRARRTMERRLRLAIDRGTLQLHYQPIVTLPSGQVRGVEALARWHDQELGSVPPDQFIPLAEQNGLIVDLGRWVLRTACADAVGWAASSVASASWVAPSVSVNVSPLQLVEPSFIDEVTAVLAETGLRPQRLCLEITETAAIDDLEVTADRLDQLRALGVHIALDDFGTGHSSLTMLRSLPVHLVKIDRSFVSRIACNAQDAVLVRLIIDAAHSLGMRVCAEGVEREDQARQLVALGCDAAQGWYFGMPEPSSGRLLTALTASTPVAAVGADDPAPLALGAGEEMILVTTPERMITYASATAGAILGRMPGDLVGTYVADYLHPSDQARLAAGEHLAALHDDGTVTHRVVHSDGSVRWIASTSQALEELDGSVREVLSVSRDVTAVVQAQQALADSEERFRQAFDNAPTAMCITDLQGRFLRANLAFADLLGVEPAGLLGKPVASVMVDGHDGHDGVRLYRHADGRVLQVRVRATVVRDRDGRPEHLVSHVTRD